MTCLPTSALARVGDRSPRLAINTTVTRSLTVAVACTFHWLRGLWSLWVIAQTVLSEWVHWYAITHTTAKMEYNVRNCTDYIVGRQLVTPAAPCVGWYFRGGGAGDFPRHWFSSSTLLFWNVPSQPGKLNSPLLVYSRMTDSWYYGLPSIIMS